MNVKLQKIQLTNYSGYRQAEFDFTDGDGIKPLALFYGPNGIGKSELLRAVDLLGTSYRFKNKDTSVLFRQLTFHPDYDPTYAGFQSVSEPMSLKGIFRVEDDSGVSTKEVVFNSNGLVKDELPEKNSLEGPAAHVFSIFADKDSERRKFMLAAEAREKFLEIAEEVYGYEVDMGREVVELYGHNESFYTDFTLKKENGVKVHFKRMSDGERKIAKVVASLCDPIWMNSINIVLIDNVEMHVYMERHVKMINKILSMFPDKQFLMTTHSPVLVGVQDPENNIDIPPAVERKYLYNILDSRMKENPLEHMQETLRDPCHVAQRQGALAQLPVRQPRADDLAHRRLHPLRRLLRQRPHGRKHGVGQHHDGRLFRLRFGPGVTEALLGHVLAPRRRTGPVVEELHQRRPVVLRDDVPHHRRQPVLPRQVLPVLHV